MKNKYRLYVHGGKKKQGLNYWGNHTSSINWIRVRSLLDIASIHELTSISIEVSIDLTQEDLYVYVFVDLTLGVLVDRNRGEWVPKLSKLIYGIKQVSENWFDILKIGIELRVDHQSQVYPCVFYRNDSVILTYVDDCVIFFNQQETITLLIKSLNNGTV